MADGFVSYSRADTVLVDALVAQLAALELDLWIDRVGIPGGARWWEELTEAIVDADTLIVVVTASCMRSRFVADEIAFAVEQHKPIVPLVHDDVVDPGKLHPALREYQWIRLGRDVVAAARNAAAAIRQDHVWRRQHSELQRRALEWDAGSGDLLGPAALRRAESWLASADDGVRVPTDLQRRFVTESRESGHRSREQERWRIGAAELRTVTRPLVVVLALFAAVSALPAAATASRALVGFRRNVVFALDIVPSIVNSVLVFLVVGLFSVWVFLACRNVARAGVAVRPSEVVTSLYLPVLGLWRPYPAMRTVAAESGAPARPWLMPTWWALWVVTVLGGVVVSHYKWWLVRPISETTFGLRFICSGRVESRLSSECYSGVEATEAVLAGFDLARVGAATLAIAVILAVTKGQERRGVDELAEVTPRPPRTWRTRLGIAIPLVLVAAAAALLAAPMNPSPRPDGTLIWCSSVLQEFFTSPQPERGDVGTDDGIVPVVANAAECAEEAGARVGFASLLLLAAGVVAWVTIRRRRPSGTQRAGARSARQPRSGRSPGAPDAA